MDFINKILELEFFKKLAEQDFAELMPDIGPIVEKGRMAVEYCVLVGPILLLLAGLIYMLIPPKEANHRFGFRTFFGMGSVKAWRFTQFVAGAAYCVLGLGLLIYALVIRKGFMELDTFQLAEKVVRCLIWQGGLIIAVRIVLHLVITVLFNHRGDRRWQKQTQRREKTNIQ